MKDGRRGEGTDKKEGTGRAEGTGRGGKGGGVKWRKRAETLRYKSERERSHSNITLIVIHVHGYVMQLRLS